MDAATVRLLPFIECNDAAHRKRRKDLSRANYLGFRRGGHSEAVSGRQAGSSLLAIFTCTCPCTSLPHLLTHLTLCLPDSILTRLKPSTSLIF